MDGNLPPPAADHWAEVLRHQGRRLPNREGEEDSTEEEEEVREAGCRRGEVAAGGCPGAGRFRHDGDGDGFFSFGDQNPLGRGESGGAGAAIEADFRRGVAEILWAGADFTDDEEGRR